MFKMQITYFISVYLTFRAAELDAGYDRRGPPQTQHGRKVMQESSKPKVNIPVQEQEQSDENNSSSSSEGESQLSSLGPWGDDPEIQEKIRYPCLLLIL